MWNSPAPSAHTTSCRTYAAPWHVQRGQTVAEAWTAEPALCRAYPGPVASLIRTRLEEGGDDTRYKHLVPRKRLEKEKAHLPYCIVLSSRVSKTNRQGGKIGQPAAGTKNRNTGVTGGHSQRSTDSRPSFWTQSSHLGHSLLLPLRNLNGSIE